MKFKTEQIQNHCTEMEATISKINERLDTINELSRQLLSSGNWSGPASQYYFTRLRKVTNQFDEVSEDLNNNLLYVKQTLENYGTMEKQVIMKVSNFFNGKW